MINRDSKNPKWVQADVAQKRTKGNNPAVDTQSHKRADGRGVPCPGKRIIEIPRPHESLIASVRQGSQVFIPNGDTITELVDLLMVIYEGQT